MAGLLGLGFAQDYDSSTESSGGPKIGDVREFWLCKVFTGKIGQSKISDLCKKIKFSKNFDMYFQICTVVLRSPISALQEGMVENVKFNHEFSLFFAQILLKNDTVRRAFGL